MLKKILTFYIGGTLAFGAVIAGTVAVGVGAFVLNANRAEGAEIKLLEPRPMNEIREDLRDKGWLLVATDDKTNCLAWGDKVIYACDQDAALRGAAVVGVATREWR